MTIYFTASVAAKHQYLKNYQTIVNFLRQHGHQVIADHILNVEEAEIQLAKREERLEFHHKLEKWIKSCDFMIAETSFPSISVGYEISLALRLGKPVLILYSEGDPPSLLAHHENDKLYCEKYRPSDVGQIIMEFISSIEGKNDTRFTFFITPQIAQFLDEIALTEKLPKSVYLRKLIEKEIYSRAA